MQLDVPLYQVARGMHEISLYHDRIDAFPMCLCKEVKLCLKYGKPHHLVNELVDVLLDLGFLLRGDASTTEKLKQRNINVISFDHGICKEVLQRAKSGGIITIDEKNLIEGLR